MNRWLKVESRFKVDKICEKETVGSRKETENVRHLKKHGKVG